MFKGLNLLTKTMGYITNQSMEDISGILRKSPQTIEISFCLLLFSASFLTNFPFILIGVSFSILEYVIIGDRKGVTPTESSSVNPHVASVEKYLACMYFVFTLLEYSVLSACGLRVDPKPENIEPVWASKFNQDLTFLGFITYQIMFGYYTQEMVKYIVFFNHTLKHKLDMLIHDVVTVLLMWYAYSHHLYMVGLYVLFLHDFCDIFLHLGKYLNYTNNTTLIVVDYIVLMFSWTYMRLIGLIYFTLSVIYVSDNYSNVWCTRTTGVMNVLGMCVLYVYHVFWWYKLLTIGCKLIAEKLI